MSAPTRRQFLQHVGSGVALTPSDVPAIMAPLRVFVSGNFPAEVLAAARRMHIVHAPDQAEGIIVAANAAMPEAVGPVEVYWAAALPQTPRQLAKTTAQLPGSNISFSLTLAYTQALRTLRAKLGDDHTKDLVAVRAKVHAREEMAIERFIDFVNAVDTVFTGSGTVRKPTGISFFGGAYRPLKANERLWIGTAGAADVSLSYDTAPKRVNYSFRTAETASPRAEYEFVFPEGALLVAMGDPRICRFAPTPAIVRGTRNDTPSWISDAVKAINNTPADHPEAQDLQAWVDSARGIVAPNATGSTQLGQLLEIAVRCRPERPIVSKTPAQPKKKVVKK